MGLCLLLETLVSPQWVPNILLLLYSRVLPSMSRYQSARSVISYVLSYPSLNVLVATELTYMDTNTAKSSGMAHTNWV